MLPDANMERGLHKGDMTRLRAAMHRLLYKGGNLTVGFMGEGCTYCLLYKGGDLILRSMDG